MKHAPLGWISIIRLGLVQSALGAIVALTTSTLNRVMVVEYALPAMLPAALVAWHYAIQLSRPRWGHGSDTGKRRTPWIVGGMGVLALGGVLAADAALLSANAPALGIALGIVAYALIGAGVGAAGTSVLALLASRVAPQRRPAAAALTWIMMIAGIVVTTTTAGALLDPFSPQRLMFIVCGVAAIAFIVALLAIGGVEADAPAIAADERQPAPGDFRAALREVWDDATARRFTIFVFVSMLAYSAQDLILEPFAGLRFAMTPGESTQLSGMQHAGVLAGLILVGVLGARIGDNKRAWFRTWIITGCVGSALALCGLSLASSLAPGWPLQLNVTALGFFNGVFAVAAIGSMMGLAGEGRNAREGLRMGLWGAAQAIAFATGGFLGAAGVDVLRAVLAHDAPAFAIVFACEAALFVAAAIMAARLRTVARAPAPLPEALEGAR